MIDRFRSLEDIVQVEWLRGAAAGARDRPQLLVEVPHGADERVHYDRLRAAMRGDLPADLHCFFHVNTDVGAWAYGRATAERIVALRPSVSVLMLRSLIPRTFVDCNRHVGSRSPEPGRAPSAGDLTPGVPPYVRDPRDLELLLDRHERYVEVVARAFELVCGTGAGGFALLPHTYGPRTMGIERVDEHIVDNLRAALTPERERSWPLRAEIDVLTRDPAGEELAPPGIERELVEAFTAAGYAPRVNDTYSLHPSSLAHRWSSEHRGRVVCLEVRRDLLVDRWAPFEEMRALAQPVARIADVLAPILARRLPDLPPVGPVGGSDR